MKKLLILLTAFLFPITTFAAVFLPAVGGTGTATKPTYGKVLVGNAGGTYDVVATSSLGITGGASLTGGTAGMLSSWVNSTTLTATGTPTAAAYTATSSTATSTFAGKLLIGTTTAPLSTALTLVQQVVNAPYSTIYGGVLGITGKNGSTGAFSNTSGMFLGQDNQTIYSAGTGFLQQWTGGVAAPISINPNGGSVTINGINNLAGNPEVGATTWGNSAQNAYAVVNSRQNGGQTGILFRGYSDTIAGTYTKSGIYFNNTETCSNYCRGSLGFLLNTTASGANVQDNITTDTRMIITPSADFTKVFVGIGTTSPTSKLAVQDNSGDSVVPTLRLASSTGATVFSVNGAGHVVTGGGAPTVSSCGTSPSISGNDTAGTVTVGSGVVTACTITFSKTRANTPRVVGIVTGGGLNITGGYSAKSTTAVTFSFAATVGSGTFDYFIVE